MTPIKKIIILCALSSFTYYSYAQKRIIDSLDKIIQSEKDTEKKVQALNLKARGVVTNDPLSAIKIGNDALALAKKINYTKGVFDAYGNIGIGYTFRSDYNPSVAYMDSALQTSMLLKDERPKTELLVNLGAVNLQFGKFDRALEYYVRAKEGFEKLKDSSNLLRCYNNLGNVFYYLGKIDDAGTNYAMAEAIAVRKNDNVMLVKIYNGLAVVALTKKDQQKALGYFGTAVKINEKVGDRLMQAGIYNNMATIYVEQKKFSEAILLFNKYRELSIILSDKKGVANAYGAMAEVYRQMGDYDNAITYFKLQSAIADTIKVYKQKMVAVKGLSEAYKEKGDMVQAYKYFEQYVIFKDSVTNQTMNQSIANITAKLENEKKEKERELKQAVLDAEHEAEIRKQKIIIYSVFVALLLALGMIYQVLRNFKQKKKANFELEKKNKIIEEKQKEIIDSINYAKRIQHTLLAHADFLNANLPDNFVYFDPKDIVSGDFYWACSVNSSQSQSAVGGKALPTATANSELFYLAVCDSTGHGVPGAFMSLLNITFLNEAINEKEIPEPNEVFNFTRKKLIESVSRDGQKDGFDGILICIDKKNKKLTYASANNPIIVVRYGKIIELESDRMPVGKGEKTDSFRLLTFDFKPSDLIYLYTDGYADQFGGPKGKKFMYKKLNELLLSISTKPLNEQKELLASTFNSWRGELEQVDDVCVIGIKL